MSLESLLQRILSEPSPDDLWDLHPRLLALDSPDADHARELTRLFYCYLSCVRSKMTSKQYSSLAATLAASSVGVIALQDILDALRTDRARAIANLLAGGLAASLETISTFQHVKAWEKEFASVHEEAVWHLYTILWQLSVETQPDLPSDKRQMLIDSLICVVRDPKVDSAARVAIVVRLFQVLLMIRLAPVWGPLARADAQAIAVE